MLQLWEYVNLQSRWQVGWGFADCGFAIAEEGFGVAPEFAAVGG